MIQYTGRILRILCQFLKEKNVALPRIMMIIITSELITAVKYWVLIKKQLRQISANVPSWKYNVMFDIVKMYYIACYTENGKSC